MAAAVRRGLKTPLLIGDMPFGSYEGSNEQAIESAQRFVKEAGCDAVKLERGGASVDRARAIIRAGIPVMGHVGLTPQTRLGARRLQGPGQDRRGGGEARRGGARPAGGRLLRDRLRGGPGGGHRGADAAARGPGDRDRRRRRRPTARCSSSTTCSASTTATPPKFVKRYADVRGQMVEGRAQLRATRCATAASPAAEHIYSIEPAELEELRRLPRPGIAASPASWDWEPLP